MGVYVRIRINVYMELARKLGWSRQELVIENDEAKVKDIVVIFDDLKKAIMSNPDEYMILVNGINIRLLEGLDTKISGDSVIDIFPPAGGG